MEVSGQVGVTAYLIDYPLPVCPLFRRNTGRHMARDWPAAFGGVARPPGRADFQITSAPGAQGRPRGCLVIMQRMHCVVLISSPLPGLRIAGVGRGREGRRGTPGKPTRECGGAPSRYIRSTTARPVTNEVDSLRLRTRGTWTTTSGAIADGLVLHPRR